MSDELRAGLVTATERFRDDLALGHHGDPHVGFVVLVHPDEPPTIVVIAESGSHTIGRIQDRKPDDKRPPKKGRFFDYQDLQAAGLALRDASSAIRLWHGMGAYGGHETVGQAVVAEIRERWQGRIDQTIETVLKKADHERRRPALCGGCKIRFTERGLSAHLARNRWCPAARASQETSA